MGVRHYMLEGLAGAPYMAAVHRGVLIWDGVCFILLWTLVKRSTRFPLASRSNQTRSVPIKHCSIHVSLGPSVVGYHLGLCVEYQQQCTPL